VFPEAFGPDQFDVGNPGVLEMEVKVEKSNCIDTWNYSFLKEYRRELPHFRQVVCIGVGVLIQTRPAPLTYTR